MKNLVLLMVLIHSAIGATGRTPIALPNLPEGETRVSSVTISYGGKMSPTQEMEFAEAAKRVESRVHWEGTGADMYLVYVRTETLNNGSMFKHIFTFHPGKSFRMKSYENSITAPDGEIVQKEFYNFNSKTKKYPETMLHPFTIDLALRTFDMKTGSKRAFDLWLTPTTIFKMETIVTGIEEIKLPGSRKAKCYRIEMAPDFADVYGSFVNSIIHPLVPKFTFWVNCDEPHIVMKYIGPLGQVNPVGGPTETQELLNYIPGSSE